MENNEIQNDKENRGGKYRKPFKDLKKSCRARRKRKLEEIFVNVCKDLPNEVKNVKVNIEIESGISLSFYPRMNVQENGNHQLGIDKDEEKDRKITQDVLCVKDRFRISDAALHELHMVCNTIPSKNRIQDERKRLNSVIQIYQWPGAAEDCATRHLTDVLEYTLQLPKYKSHFESGNPNVKLLVRFAFDGAKITKKINSVRGVVKILQPRDALPELAENISMCPEDELTLFFYLGDENRATFEKYATNTLNDMERAAENGIMVAGKRVTIEWLATCDWKALTILRGINPANSDYFCLWCYCQKRQICDFSIPSWGIQRSATDQLRSIEQREQGYNLPDLGYFIPYCQMVPDDLHLRIRISLKLFNQVVSWAIDQKAERKLVDELQRIGMNFHFWEERGDGKSSTSVKKWSQPNGDDLRVILKEMRLSNVLDERADRHFVTVEALSLAQLRDELEERGLSKTGKKPQLVARLHEALGHGEKVRKKSSRSRLQVSYDYDENGDDESIVLDVDALQEVWDNFDSLMNSLKALPSSDAYLEPDIFMESARRWAQDFRKCTFDEDVTPYIHALVYHIPYFLRKYRYLHDIGVSQVERKNFDHRQAYFGSTNRNGGKNKEKISVQILQRENRMLWALHEGHGRKKRDYKKKDI